MPASHELKISVEMHQKFIEWDYGEKLQCRAHWLEEKGKEDSIKQKKWVILKGLRDIKGKKNEQP